MDTIRDRAGRWSSRCYGELKRNLGTTDLTIADYSRGAVEQNEVDIMKIQRELLTLRLEGHPMVSRVTFQEFIEFSKALIEAITENEDKKI